MARKTKTTTAQPDLYPSSIPRMPGGYYSGDKPNPNLRAFVETHLRERPYDPATDDYDVPAFDRPIETTKATAIFNMHTYWSKKPHDAIREYIRHYTQPGDLVLDPFCGSGGTALAALMEGRKAIAIDRSPAATFITKNYCTPIDPAELQTAFEELERKVRPEMDWLYETRCDRCGGKATTAYTVYSQVFQCPRCLTRVPLFDCPEAAGQTTKGEPKKIRICPHCAERGLEEEISTRDERFGAVPVLVSYICETCKPGRAERRHNDPEPTKRRYFEQYDLAKLAEIEAQPIPHWYPQHRMMNVDSDTEPWGDEWRPGRNFRTVAELFTKRNLWALAAIRSVATYDHLRLALNSILLNSSRLYRNRYFGGGGPTGTFYLPQESREYAVWPQLAEKVNEYLQVRNIFQSTDAMVSTATATELSVVPSVSVDFIFTDPPYANKVQYGELNFIWEAWLGFDTRWHGEEVIVNETRGKTSDDWAAMLRQAMAECYRVLRPGRWLSLCYHDTAEGTWRLVQDVMARVGFVPDRSENALFIDTAQKSYNQLTADKVTKRDLVINFRKPKPGETAGEFRIDGDEDASTFTQKAHTVIRDYLLGHPGATKDRIYDELVSRMVRAGQMQAHNFDELLAQVAEPVSESVMKNLFEPASPDLFGSHEIVRWYLRETETAIADAAESAKEDAAAQSVTRFMTGRLEADPGAEGVHFSDIWEHYVYTVKDKPRRHLADWLSDYFYQTESGTYRLPASEDERQLKAQGRAAGTSRHIRRYLGYLQQGAAVPEHERPTDATLAEWIRHCKRAGLFEQGKLVYEKGGINLDTLSEEVMVGVEEDYQVCVRILARGNSPSEKQKKRR
jgi:DNA modification methylase